MGGKLNEIEIEWLIDREGSWDRREIFKMQEWKKIEIEIEKRQLI